MGWRFVQWSFAFVWQYKRMVLLPAVSLAVAAGVTLIYAVPFTLAQLTAAPALRQQISRMPLTILVSAFSTFIGCAQVWCVQTHFSGREPNLIEGIKAASARWQPIAVFGLINAVEGFVMSQLASQGGLVASVLWVFNIGWIMATCLLTPVVMAEGRGSMRSLGRSIGLVPDTAGDQILGMIGFGLRVMAAAIVCGIVAFEAWPNYKTIAGVSIACFAVVLIVVTAAWQVFAVVLYRYATLGHIPEDWHPVRNPGLGEFRRLA